MKELLKGLNKLEGEISGRNSAFSVQYFYPAQSGICHSYYSPNFLGLRVNKVINNLIGIVSSHIERNPEDLFDVAIVLFLKLLLSYLIYFPVVALHSKGGQK